MSVSLNWHYLLNCPSFSSRTILKMNDQLILQKNGKSSQIKPSIGIKKAARLAALSSGISPHH